MWCQNYQWNTSVIHLFQILKRICIFRHMYNKLFCLTHLVRLYVDILPSIFRVKKGGHANSRVERHRHTDHLHSERRRCWWNWYSWSWWRWLRSCSLYRPGNRHRQSSDTPIPVPQQKTENENKSRIGVTSSSVYRYTNPSTTAKNSINKSQIGTMSSSD